MFDGPSHNGLVCMLFTSFCVQMLKWFGLYLVYKLLRTDTMVQSVVPKWPWTLTLKKVWLRFCATYRQSHRQVYILFTSFCVQTQTHQYDLDLWPLTLKNNRCHSLVITSMFTMFEGPSPNGSVFILFTSFFVQTYQSDLDLWPLTMKIIGVVLWP